MRNKTHGFVGIIRDSGLILLILLLAVFGAVPSGTMQMGKVFAEDGGNAVYFGHYYQTLIDDPAELDAIQMQDEDFDESGKAVIDGIKVIKTRSGYFKSVPIQWRILKDNGSTYTLISEKVLADRHFGGENVWRDSDMRRWLNEEFYNDAFTDEEKAAIVTTDVETLDKTYDDWRTRKDGTWDVTSDKVWLLYSDEAFDESFGFTDDESRIAYATDFVNKENAAYKWWLRGYSGWSYGNRQNEYIKENGQSASYYQTYGRGVRPVIVVSKSAVKTAPEEEKAIKRDISRLTSRFVLGKDNNSFYHGSPNDINSGFFGVYTYDMGLEYLNAYKKDSGIGRGDAALLYLSSNLPERMKNKNWIGGWCYGIATTMGLVHEGYLSVSDISDDNASTYFDMAPPARNERLKNTINYYHVANGIISSKAGHYVTFPKDSLAGELDSSADHIQNFDDFLETLVTCSKSQDIVFGYAGEGGGHAVLIVDQIYNKATKTYTLAVYDENCISSSCPKGVFYAIDIDLNNHSLKYTNHKGEVILDSTASKETTLCIMPVKGIADATKSGIQTAKNRSWITVPLREGIKIMTGQKNIISMKKGGEFVINALVYDLIPLVGDSDALQGEAYIQVEIDRTDDLIIENTSGKELSVEIRTADDAAILKGNISKASVSMNDGIKIDGDVSDYAIGISGYASDENAEKPLVLLSGKEDKDIQIKKSADGDPFEVVSPSVMKDVSVSYYNGSDFIDGKINDATSAQINSTGSITSENSASLKVGTTEKVKGSAYKVLSTESKTVALTKAKNVKSIVVPATVNLSDGNTYKVTTVNAKAFKGAKIRNVTIGKNVKVIKKNALKGSKATKLILKTKLLKKTKVKGCLKSSKIKTVQVKVGSKKQNKTYIKKYKKIFTKANAGKKIKIR